MVAMADPKTLPDLVAEEATADLKRLKLEAKKAGRDVDWAEVCTCLVSVLAKYRITKKHDPKPRPAKKEQTEEEWITGLESVPAYKGIDIRRELGKCQVWAKEARVLVSRRRFVNWLNKVPAPLSFNGVGQSSLRGAARSDIYKEPEGWRDTLRFIGGKWDREKVDELCRGEWLDLPATVRAEILKANS
jgi:hypothetical protein